MNAITTRQFVTAAFAYSVGFGLWAFPAGSPLKNLGAIVLCFSGFIGMHPSERSRPLRRADMFLILLVVPAFVLLAIGIDHLFPGILADYLHHPVLIALLWALSVWRLFRRWQFRDASANGTVA